MGSKIIGFVGIEKYEIMHYLSRVLRQLGQTVLLTDQSTERALACSVPAPFPNSREIMDYDGVDVALNAGLEELPLSDYQYILADFGFQVRHPMLGRCDAVYLVSDQQLHNIRGLSAIQLENHQRRYLILKEYYAGRFSPACLFEEMKPLMINEENSYALQIEERDYENCLNCQYEDQISMKRLSRPVKRLLYEILLSDFSAGQIDRALRLAERGR